MASTPRDLLRDRIAELRRLSYDELKALVGTSSSDEVELPRESVVVQTMGFWDDERKGHVRIVVSADDGGIRAFLPVSESFIVAPDGSFVGE